MSVEESCTILSKWLVDDSRAFDEKIQKRLKTILESLRDPIKKMATPTVINTL